MPSDLAKKKAAKKKEAAKARQRTKKTEEANGESEQQEAQLNGAESNGKKTEEKHWLLTGFVSLWQIFLLKLSCFFVFLKYICIGVENLTKELDEFELRKTEARAVTGVLASHPNSTDVHISSLSLTFHGQELLADTSLELNSGRRYGLIGLNGTGN